MPTDSDTDVAIDAASVASELIRNGYGRPVERFGKGEGDFATNVDLAAERAVRQLLRERRPSDAIVGEEYGADGHGSRTWLVDPLCGTLNFAAHTPLVAVNVALRVGDRVTAAVSADPLSGEVFWTDGTAAFVRRAGRDERLTPQPGDRLVDLNLDPPFPNADSFRAARLLTDDDFTERFRPRVISTSLALAWVAAGRRAALVTDGHVRDSVHFASGIALCRAAGCVVTNLAGGPPHTGVQGVVAAADPATHRELITMVARQLDE